MKAILLPLFITASLVVSIPVFSATVNKVSSESELVSKNAPTEITYEHVFADGHWWIYVYEDKIFVHRYLDDEWE